MKNVLFEIYVIYFLIIHAPRLPNCEMIELEDVYSE